MPAEACCLRVSALVYPVGRQVQKDMENMQPLGTWREGGMEGRYFGIGLFYDVYIVGCCQFCSYGSGMIISCSMIDFHRSICTFSGLACQSKASHLHKTL